MVKIPPEIANDNKAIASVLVAYVVQALLSEPIDVTIVVTEHLLEAVREFERAKYEEHAARGKAIAAGIDLEGGETDESNG